MYGGGSLRVFVCVSMWYCCALVDALCVGRGVVRAVEELCVGRAAARAVEVLCWRLRCCVGGRGAAR